MVDDQLRRRSVGSPAAAHGRALFVERHERWAALALTYLDQLDANYALDSRAAWVGVEARASA